MKKRLLFLLTFLLVIPFNTFALECYLDEENAVYEKGKTVIDIKVNNYIGSEFQTGKLACVDSDGIHCSIEANSSNAGASYNGEGRFVWTETLDPSKPIGRLVLTNDSTEDKTSAIIFKYGDNLETEQRVNRPVKGKDKPKSNNAKLSELKTEVGNLSPAFSSDTKDYTLYGVSDANRRFKFYYKCDNCSVKISGGVSSTKSSEEGYNGAWYVELNIGENPITITVEAEDGNSFETYKVNAIRGETGYGSSKLKSLTIGEYKFDPEFKSDTLEYKVSIPKKLSNIAKLLQYEAEDKEANVEVKGADTLDNDENEVTITVTGRNGDKTVYKLTVVKEDEVQAVIDVIGYKDDKVTFIDTEGNSQTLSKEEFKTQYPDEWTKIENGTYKFDEDGNIIRESNSKEETKTEEKKKDSFPWIIVILIVLAIAVIAVSGYFIFRDPSKKKKKKGEEDPKVPTEEEKEHLEDIDSYNEEARLIAEDNIRNDNKEIDDEKEDISSKEEDNVEEIEPDEAGVEEEIVRTETVDDYSDEEKSATMDIDEALSDLMNTKEYNFKDKL